MIFFNLYKYIVIYLYKDYRRKMVFKINKSKKTALRLFEKWLITYPELRFGQAVDALSYAAKTSGSDIFYLEDEDITALLLTMMNNGVEEK